VLSGRLCAAFFNRTRRLVTPVTFKEKLCAFAAAQTAHRISIPSQVVSASSLLLQDGKVYRPMALHPLGCLIADFQMPIAD
jgi:hypothetical protein